MAEAAGKGSLTSGELSGTRTPVQVVRLSQSRLVVDATLRDMSATVRPRRARDQLELAGRPDGRVLASDPRALSDAAAFALLVLALAGVLGLILLVLTAVGALHFA